MKDANNFVPLYNGMEEPNWYSCEHIWKDKIDSMTERDCYCIKCKCPGEREENGSVFWPIT